MFTIYSVNSVYGNFKFSAADLNVEFLTDSDIHVYECFCSYFN